MTDLATLQERVERALPPAPDPDEDPSDDPDADREATDRLERTAALHRRHLRALDAPRAEQRARAAQFFLARGVAGRDSTLAGELVALGLEGSGRLGVRFLVALVRAAGPAAGPALPQLFERLEALDPGPAAGRADPGLRRLRRAVAELGRHPLEPPALDRIVEAAEGESALLRETALEALAVLAVAGRKTLAGGPVHCTRCLRRWTRHGLRRGAFTRAPVWLCCRRCRGTHAPLSAPGGCVAVLDAGFGDATRRFYVAVDSRHAARPWVLGDGILRVNWLALREAFDFDRVEIGSATDAEVEAFALSQAADPLPGRPVPCERAPVTISRSGALGVQTVAILRRVFGDVRRT